MISTGDAGRQDPKWNSGQINSQLSHGLPQMEAGKVWETLYHQSDFLDGREGPGEPLNEQKRSDSTGIL